MKAPAGLRPQQARGALPSANAWVSASAGSGKTQVLSARVLRLLLDGTEPSRILCLTFTKAAAAEMQQRVFGRLAHWVRLDDAALGAELAAIRADTGPPMLARARQLFARTLDARGGLQVQTLHAFAQSLLASFPVEAGVPPGFTTLDERSDAALRHRILADTITDAAAAGDTQFAGDVGALSIAAGEARVNQIAAILIRHYPAIAALGTPASYEPGLRRLLDLPTGGSAEEVVGGAIARLDELGLRRLAQAQLRDGGKTALSNADKLLGWLGCSPANRLGSFDDLAGMLLTKDGEPRKKFVPQSQARADASLEPLYAAMCDAVTGIVETRRKLEVAANAARHLRVGARLGAAYVRYKARAGVIDYDEMIARAAALLTRDGMGAWVRFKLDARIDHLLLDEAQDTSAPQWAIVAALTDEFFDGAGARDAQRTLFVVGDFKQAIFSFQGSDPRLFQDQRDHFHEKAISGGGNWDDVPLAESFRSVPAVLEVVDAVIDTLTPAAFGVRDEVFPHTAARADLPGRVTLWPPLAVDDDAGADPDTPWVPDPHIRMAHKLGAQIAAWLDPATALYLPARGRNVRPEDILVLVRKRGEFMGPLVAALHAHGVPVAGVDRLQLTQPMAVQDLLALVRFALQPDDDLTLAALLMSPLGGLDHDALFALAFDREAASLWTRLRRSQDPAAVAAAAWLGEVLALADFDTPYNFLETVLSGPTGGRRRLLGRLGDEARDAIDALLGQALQYEAVAAPSLQGFLAWIEADDRDLKRDLEAAHAAVRIMTVHGAKGLQAPVVVLADATRDLDAERDPHVLIGLDGGEQPVPVFHGGKAGKLGRIAEEALAVAAARCEEHWRLLYVALTRAEDLLFIGGALAKPRGDKPPLVPESSWHAAVERALDRHYPTEPEPDALWGAVRCHRAGSAAPVRDAAAAATAVSAVAALPVWARTGPPAETRPPRPLSPSALAADDVAAPPPGPAAQAAARRGQLIHSLFERLPEVAPGDRRAAALYWLSRQAATDATRIADTVLAIIDDPRFAALFGPGSLAEAPIVAVVGGLVIAGKVDRLLVADDRIAFIDFKTGWHVPAGIDTVAPYHLRQMAAYAAALGAIFPGRAVAGALLYTHDATLIELPPRLLAALAPSAGAVP